MKQSFQFVPAVVWFGCSFYYLMKSDGRTCGQRYDDAKTLYTVFFLVIGALSVLVAVGLLCAGIGSVLGEIPIIGIVFMIFFKIIGASGPVIVGGFLLKVTVNKYQENGNENGNEIVLAIIGVLATGLELFIYF